MTVQVSLEGITRVLQKLEPQYFAEFPAEVYGSLQQIREKTLTKCTAVMTKLKVQIENCERKVLGTRPSLFGRFLYAFGFKSSINEKDKEIFASQEHLKQLKFYKDMCEKVVISCCIKEEQNRKCSLHLNRTPIHNGEYTKLETCFIDENF